MTRKISTFLFFVFLFCVSMEAMGQDFQSLREKAKDVVKAKRSEWKLFHKYEERKEVTYSWGSVRKGIGLLIYYGDSQKDASERMEFTNNILSVGPGNTLKDIGDEAYYSKSARSDFARIRFRKANVYFEVSAPTLTMAEDIAKDLAKLIKRK